MRLDDRKNFFSKKVIQNLSKTVSIVLLRPMVAEISIVVTRVVKPLTTKVHPTVGNRLGNGLPDRLPDRLTGQQENVRLPDRSVSNLPNQSASN